MFSDDRFSESDEWPQLSTSRPRIAPSVLALALALSLALLLGLGAGLALTWLLRPVPPVELLVRCAPADDGLVVQ